jgi:hypothetical protein
MASPVEFGGVNKDVVENSAGGCNAGGALELRRLGNLHVSLANGLPCGERTSSCPSTKYFKGLVQYQNHIY